VIIFQKDFKEIAGLYQSLPFFPANTSQITIQRKGVPNAALGWDSCATLRCII